MSRRPWAMVVHEDRRRLATAHGKRLGMCRCKTCRSRSHRLPMGDKVSAVSVHTTRVARSNLLLVALFSIACLYMAGRGTLNASAPSTRRAARLHGYQLATTVSFSYSACPGSRRSHRIRPRCASYRSYYLCGASGACRCAGGGRCDVTDDTHPYNLIV